MTTIHSLKRLAAHCENSKHNSQFVVSHVILMNTFCNRLETYPTAYDDVEYRVA